MGDGIRAGAKRPEHHDRVNSLAVVVEQLQRLCLAIACRPNVLDPCCFGKLRDVDGCLGQVPRRCRFQRQLP